MGEIFGVSQVAWTYWETGKREPNITTILKICKYFNVSADYLLGLSSDAPEQTTYTLKVAEPPLDYMA